MLVVVVALALAGLFYWAFNPSVEPIEVRTDRSEPRASSEPTSPTVERRSVLDEVRRRDEPASSSADAAAPAPDDDEPSRRAESAGGPALESPLTGLSVTSISASELRQQGVPDAFEGGVVITRVEPDSPADEDGLVPGDIIVEARMKPVLQPEDLERLVGDHSFAKVTFIRDGQVLQVVLQRPFRPN